MISSNLGRAVLTRAYSDQWPPLRAREIPEADRLAGTWLRQMRSACGTLCRLAASESMSQTGLLDGEGPWPVIAVPQPAWADAHMHDVVIMGALRAVRVLG
jgi:hypothetical protein